MAILTKEIFIKILDKLKIDKNELRDFLREKRISLTGIQENNFVSLLEHIVERKKWYNESLSNSETNALQPNGTAIYKYIKEKVKNKHWWEKTVEYKFVLKHLKELHEVYPFDGNHEAAGDAIIQDDKEFILIEFKRNSECVKSELEKFEDDDYLKYIKKAMDDLKIDSSPHFLIYGELNQTGTSIDLLATQYVERKNEAVGNYYKYRLPKHEFDKYLQLFLQIKSSKSSTGFLDYSNVIGVSSDGAVDCCLGLDEYIVRNAELKIKKGVIKSEDVQNIVENKAELLLELKMKLNPPKPTSNIRVPDMQ